jgi:hypothetical protein
MPQAQSGATPDVFEFSEAQNGRIETLVKRMREVNRFFVLVGILGMILGVMELAGGQGFQKGITTVVWSGMYIVIALMTLSAAKYFDAIVKTSGQDIQNLMAAVAKLARVSTLQAWLLMGQVALSIWGLYGLVMKTITLLRG